VFHACSCVFFFSRAFFDWGFCFFGQVASFFSDFSGGGANPPFFFFFFCIVIRLFWKILGDVAFPPLCVGALFFTSFLVSG